MMVCDSNLLTVANFMHTNGQQAAGWWGVWIDDGWQYTNGLAPDGSLLWNSNAFPRGIPAMIADIHALGLKVGIYTAFSRVTCEEFPGTIPANVYRHMQQFATWGCDGVKVDYCSGINYDTISFAYNNAKSLLFTGALLATGRQMLMCNFDGMSQTSFVPTPSWYVRQSGWVNASPPGGMWSDNGNLAAVWPGVKSQAQPSYSYLVGPGRLWNITGLVFFQNEGGGSVKAYYGVSAILASCVFSGTSIEQIHYLGNYEKSSSGPSTWMNNDMMTYATNSEVMAVVLDRGAIPGHPAFTNGTDTLETWVRPLTGQNNHSSAAVLLINMGTSGAQNITVTASQLGFLPSDSFSVRSTFWQTNVGTFTGSWTYSVNQNDLELFTIK
jgi:alpha-galactosidase